jgi:hypothetical protein
MLPWDSFIQKSTNQLGSSAARPTTPFVNPATGGSNIQNINNRFFEPTTAENQLAVRRELDNSVRYGRPSAVSQDYAARIGAI